MAEHKFKLWPDPPNPAVPYGPTGKQRLLWIEELPDEDLLWWDGINVKRPHYHPMDVVLYVGAARCFGIGTEILMFDGTIKKVEEIVPGDLLMGPDSTPRTVSTLHQGEDELFQINPDKGKPWVCNSEHSLFLYRRERGYKGKRIDRYDKISVEDYLHKSKYYKRITSLMKGEIEFPSTALEIEPYYLGLWLGDGNSQNTGVTTMDFEVVDYLAQYAKNLNMDLREGEQPNNKANTYFITTHNKLNPLHKKLVDEDLIYNKHIPHKYLCNAKENRMLLLAGLIDSDGCLAKLKNGCEHMIWVNANSELATQVAFLAEGLGFRVTNKKCLASWIDQRTGQKRTGFYDRVYINGDDLHLIPTKIARKKAKTKEGLKWYNYRGTGFEVEPLGKGDYYGFSLEEEDDRFLLGDFTITYNSGKTLSAQRRVMKYLNDYPNAVAIVGAENFKQLKRNVIDNEWQPVFSHKSPWDMAKMPGSPIIRRPVTNDQQVTFANGSIAYFLHLKEEAKLKGLKASVISFEEADMLPHEGAFEELMARLSNENGPVMQLILTTNPLKARKGWIKDKFKLYQSDPGYKGEIEPIVPPCDCQICPKCSSTDDEGLDGGASWLFIEPITSLPSTAKGSICPNPDCYFLADTSRAEEVGAKDKDGNPILKSQFTKDNDCPGHQIWFRVIETASSENPHKRSTYEKSAGAGMSAKTRRAMIEGKIEQDHEGEVYKALSQDNILLNPLKLDMKKDIVWTLDFNYDPQCSVVLQETETEEGFSVIAIEEIILWDKLPEDVAEHFCMKFHEFKSSGRTVKIWADPASIGQKKGSTRTTMYQTVINYLRQPTNKDGKIDKENGLPFTVQMMQKKDTRSYKDPLRERLTIYISERVDAVNTMLCDPNTKDRRLYINRNCKALIMSLEGVKWNSNPQSDDKFDKSIDKTAALHRETLKPMTHPSDALGYYIAKRFPLIKHKKGIMVMHSISKDKMHVFDGENVTEYTPTTSRAEEREARIAAIKERLSPKKDSLASLIGNSNKKNPLRSIRFNVPKGPFR